MTMIRISEIRWPVTTLGPGNRAGVWFQGCRIGCLGCMSKQTWDSSGGQEFSPDHLVERIAAVCGASLEGVTISGGEPLKQVDGLLQLLAGLRDSFPDADILLYSGHEAAQIRDDHTDLPELCDAIVAGPFEAGRAAGDHWRGSDNQELMVLSDRGRRRILPWTEDQTVERLQVDTSGDTVHIVGIPRRGELQRLAKSLTRRGLIVDERRWVR